MSWWFWKIVFYQMIFSSFFFFFSSLDRSFVFFLFFLSGLLVMYEHSYIRCYTTKWLCSCCQFHRCYLLISTYSIFFHCQLLTEYFQSMRPGVFFFSRQYTWNLLFHSSNILKWMDVWRVHIAISTIAKWNLFWHFFWYSFYFFFAMCILPTFHSKMLLSTFFGYLAHRAYQKLSMFLLFFVIRYIFSFLFFSFRLLQNLFNQYVGTQCHFYTKIKGKGL